MVSRVDRPYWFNWLSWHLHQRHRFHRAAARRAAWEFVNRIREMPPGSLVIDGGANVGRVSAAFLEHGFEVHAFEPDPFAFAILEQRFKDQPSVHLHAAALGPGPGVLTLYRTTAFAERPEKATISSSLFARDIHDKAHAVDVPVVDLVSFVTSLGRPVALIKLDIEGAEVAILERILDEGLHRDVGAIYVETHERHSPEIAEGTKRLRKRIAADGVVNVNLDWR